ncbi:receptor-like protein 7 [Humulus lupulus]|uniref:receptor-like protein 7 n=1 Tax=Humulus lupulus TaxID=3486 RepID=UPI002B40D110|nr:receptor-like protein 7 [Humulus lupulus]
MWDGVECDELTGHVIGLDLKSSFLYGSIDSNSSLFNLLHLQFLDLFDNHFNYSQIPPAIRRLSKLTYLNLQASVFSGQIPSEISQLSKLSHLYLSGSVDPVSKENLLELKRQDLESLLLNLTNLEDLGLSYVDIKSTLPDSLANLSSLTTLAMKNCKLKGEFPVNIFQLPNLQLLTVRFNEDLSGRLPEVLNQNSSLEILLLSGTYFSGDLPTSIENLASLIQLEAKGCNFSGVIPSSIGKLNQLIELDLSKNKFTGKITSNLANLTQLTALDLSSNHLSGSIPSALSKLKNLESLILSGNDLSGTVDFDMFSGLQYLYFLDLSRNKLSLVVSSRTNHSFPQFKVLKLSDCNLKKFPDFLRHQKRMGVLSIGRNPIGGQIQEWMLNISRETLSTIFFSGNSFTGELSPKICNLSSLQVLDFSNNELVGKLPQCFGNFSKSLSIITLTNNSFSGNIPEFTIGNQLQIIHLGYNLFEGKLSKSLTNCRMLGFLDVESNNLNDVFPHWLGSLPELEVLMLRANEFHGAIKEPKTNLVNFPKLRIIDASYNNFIDKLPLKYIQSWEAMKSTSVEGFDYMWTPGFNHLYEGTIIPTRYTFSITTEIKGMYRSFPKIQNIIAIINLSNNKFDGEISEIIGNIKGLYSLDLSNNRLKGTIPQYHLSSFESSSYEGNLGLCGIPLQNLCEKSNSLKPALPVAKQVSSSPFQFDWKVVVIGYACGFFVGLFIGEIVIARKPTCFRTPPPTGPLRHTLPTEPPRHHRTTTLHRLTPMANERNRKFSRIEERRENESLAPLKHKRKRRLQIIEDSPELEKSTHVKDKPKRRLRIIEDSPELENSTHVKDKPKRRLRIFEESPEPENSGL